MIKQLTTALGALAVGVCAFMYYQTHLKWRSCFNEQGRCFDPDSAVVHHAHSGEVWLIFTLISGAALLLHLVRSKR